MAKNRITGSEDAMQGQETPPSTAERLDEELVTRPDRWVEDGEEGFGAHLRPEDWPPRRVLTFRDLVKLQRHLKGNRTPPRVQSSNGRLNS